VLLRTPLLRAINLSIAVLLIALFVAGYRYLWRPLPQTSGELRAPVSARATVVRDSLGVPHISAASWEDAIFLQGYVTAQDRMWQMDALRRLSAGELAEVIGPALLESDREARRMMLARLAEAQERVLSPDARGILAAYARGVNFYLENQRGNWPVEFALLSYEPRPWLLRDTLLVGLQMQRTLTTSWPDDLRKSRLLAKGDAKKLAYIYAAHSGPEVAPGSNAWAISGSRSATGKPILANDPHLEFTIPSTWYLVHLKAPDLDVTGASLPGVPAVIIGHNQRIAWGMTNLYADVQDLYREQIDQQTGRYVYRGAAQQAIPAPEPIVIRGQRTLEGITWTTRHGPILVNEQNRSYALRWAAAEFPGREFPFLDLNRARNWQEFNAALRNYFGPGQNAVYADVDGNIGYHAAGAVPIRRGCDGSVPVDGSTEECEWTGMIPYDELPSVYNPPGGVIVSANQNPFPAGYRYAVGSSFPPPERAREIRARLDARAKWKPEDMLDIQKDVYSAVAHYLTQEAVQAFYRHPVRSEELLKGVEVLSKWNGQMEKGTPEPMAAALFMAALQKLVAQNAIKDATDDDSAGVTVAVLEKLIRERPEGWFPSYDQLLIDALRTGIEEGVKIQGSKVAAWDYGQWRALRLTHPILGQLPWIGKYFNIGTIPMSGSPTSIKQTTRRLGPSMRMVVDFSNLDNSWANITVGQSGHRLSRHYRDQWAAYYGGTSFPMQYGKVEARDTLVVTPK
jgi:penicillin amidase